MAKKTKKENEMVDIKEKKTEVKSSKYGMSEGAREYAQSLINDKKKGLAFLKKHGFIDKNNELHPNYK